MHYIVLYPQNGDRIMTTDSVTSLHTKYKLRLTVGEYLRLGTDAHTYAHTDKWTTREQRLRPAPSDGWAEA